MLNIKDAQLGFDCACELDVYDNPRLISEAELVKDVVMTVLFTKPGQYPSLPHIGLDIHNMLYSMYDKLNIENLIIQLSEQCQALDAYIKNGSIAIKKTIYRNMPSLLIYVNTGMNDSNIQDMIESYERDTSTIFRIGLSINELNELLLVENKSIS